MQAIGSKGKKRNNFNLKDVSNKAIDDTFETYESKTDNKSGIIDKHHYKFST